MQEMTDLQKRLFEFRDEKNAAFQAKLAPTVPPETCLGCRVPDLRKFAIENEQSHKSNELMDGFIKAMGKQFQEMFKDYCKREEEKND